MHEHSELLAAPVSVKLRNFSFPKQGFAVWDGDKEEVESIDDIVERLAGGEDDKDGSAQSKGRPGLKRTTFSWRDFGKNRPIRRSDQD